MPLLIATVGGSTSNAYADTTAADNYSENRWWGATWQQLDMPNKEVALISATAALETITWKGERCSPSSDDAKKPQALSWPRTKASCDGVAASCDLIPANVLNAMFELAFQLSQDPGALQPGSGSTGQAGVYTSKEKLGDLEVNYTAFPSGGGGGTDCSSCSDPKVISVYPWLADYLKCWTDAGSAGSRVILRVRS